MREILSLCICFLGILGFSNTALGQSVTLSLGSGQGIPGGSVVLPITITSLGGAQAADIQWAFTYSTDITGVTAVLGSSGVSSQKSLTCNGNLCLVTGLNATIIPNGTVATATFQVAANPSNQTIPIQLTAVVTSSATGTSIPSSGGSGTITLPTFVAFSALNCSPLMINTPGTTSCTVSLNGTASSGGVSVSLSSNNTNLTVPLSVTIAAGQTSNSFIATGAQVSANQSALVTASAGGVNLTNTLSLLASVQISTLACAPSTLGSNSSSNCTVVLTAPASSAATVALTSSNGLLTVPASVVVEAGQSSATFTATSGTVSGNQSAIVTATFSGQSQAVTVSLTASAQLSNLTCSPATVNAPGTSLCTVTLTAAAVSAASVTLSSNNASVTVPASVNIGTGLSSVTFTATVASVTSNQTALLTSTLNGSSQTFTLTSIAPAQLSSLACAPTALSSGASSTCTVSLNQVTPVAALISVGSNNAIVSVPVNVTVPVGQNTTIFEANVGNVSSGQNAIITASFNGSNQSTTLSLSVPPVPSAVSVSPSASAGTTQAFTFVFSDSQSAANLSTLAILFAPSVAYPNSCFVVFDQNRGTVQLEWDNMTGSDAKPISSTLTLQNSQCMIGTTTVTASALSETITMAVTFKGGFIGLKNIYMYGADGNGTINTGWVQRGAYTVAFASAPVPSAVSVSPSANSGTTQTFAFVLSDSQSSNNLSAAAMLFSSSGVYPNSCFIVYDRTQGTIQLEWDNVAGDNALPVGSPLVLENSQCLVNGTSITTSALTTTITMTVTFQGAFSGLKNIYLYGADGNGTINTGWVQMGTYAVTTVSAPVPSADSVSPNGSGGGAQDFTFVFSDSQNAANLSTAAMLFASSLAYPNSCFVIYDRNRGTIQLEWDSVTGADLMSVGSSTTLQNSQCIIGASSVTISGLTNIITLYITFKNTFSGLKKIYLYGADGDGTINTGWVQLGTWTPF